MVKLPLVYLFKKSQNALVEARESILKVIPIEIHPKAGQRIERTSNVYIATRWVT